MNLNLQLIPHIFLDLCPSSKILSCQALEGADGCDTTNGQCKCGTSTSCSGTMPVCRNPGTAFAFCSCRQAGNGQTTSCKEPNPTCGSDGICAVIFISYFYRISILNIKCKK